MFLLVYSPKPRVKAAQLDDQDPLLTQSCKVANVANREKSNFFCSRFFAFALDIFYPLARDVKKPSNVMFEGFSQFSLPQAAANQYPELNGLLMRSASGEISSSLSVGMASSPSAATV